MRHRRLVRDPTEVSSTTKTTLLNNTLDLWIRARLEASCSIQDCQTALLLVDTKEIRHELGDAAPNLRQPSSLVIKIPDSRVDIARMHTVDRDVLVFVML